MAPLSAQTVPFDPDCFVGVEQWLDPLKNPSEALQRTRCHQHATAKIARREVDILEKIDRVRTQGAFAHPGATDCQSGPTVLISMRDGLVTGIAVASQHGGAKRDKSGLGLYCIAEIGGIASADALQQHLEVRIVHFHVDLFTFVEQTKFCYDFWEKAVATVGTVVPTAGGATGMPLAAAQAMSTAVFAAPVATIGTPAALATETTKGPLGVATAQKRRVS